MDPDLGLFGSAFAILFGLAVVFIVGIVVLILVISVRNARKTREAGHDPFTLQTDLAVSALDSDLLAPAKTLEQRLAELDDLYARGLLSDAEHAAGRAAAIEGR